MDTPQILLLIFGGIALLLAALYIGASAFAFRLAFLRGKKKGREEPLYENDQLRPFHTMRMEALALAKTMPQEEITLKSRDGLALRARLYDTPDAIGSILLFHGYRSFGECDFGCILSYYRDTRHLRVMLIDQRAHGDSEGKYITFGDLERYDCVDWTHYIARRFGNQPILLDGMSMGAATVLLASGEPLPENVVGILADCGYSSAEGILREVGKSMKMPVGLILPMVRWICRTVGHFDPMLVSVPKALAKSTLPVLIIHGTADSFVPYEMSVENSRVREGIRLVSVEGADHGMSYLINPTLVIQELDAFFDRVLA